MIRLLLAGFILSFSLYSTASVSVSLAQFGDLENIKTSQKIQSLFKKLSHEETQDKRSSVTEGSDCPVQGSEQYRL